MSHQPPPAPTTEDPSLTALHRMEIVISRVLQAGVVLSMTIVTLGMVLWATHPTGASHTDPSAYSTTLLGVWRGVLALDPLAVLQLGLLTLILTPVIRVAASALVFIRDRDTAYTLITLVVLGLLLFGIFHGGGE